MQYSKKKLSKNTLHMENVCVFTMKTKYLKCRKKYMNNICDCLIQLHPKYYQHFAMIMFYRRTKFKRIFEFIDMKQS